MRGLSIRPMRRGDLDVRFTGKFRPFGEECFERQERAEICVAVAELKGVPVGHVCLDVTGGAADGIAYLSAAGVDPEHQSHGIGTALFLHLEDLARERGLRVIRLAVAKENMRAVALYERLGYRVCGEEISRWSYRDGGEVVDVAEDCWTLEKHLSTVRDSRRLRERFRRPFRLLV